MFRKLFPVFLVSTTLSICFAACGGGGEEDECVVCDNAGGAVKCHVGFITQTICAPDQDLAAATCSQGGGVWEAVPLCPVEFDETGEDPGNEPWDPGQDITFDRATDVYVIRQLAFEELKLDSSALFGDSSEVRELESGYYEVAVSGQLTNALGWQVGDVLLDVNGYGLRGLAEFAVAYASLADQAEFELTILRGRDQVVSSYRVE